ncbi:hypothetical protein PA7_19830 [Pseudonocardia asaccharolytica DSM 44247 = NBRC 16224]|uniref:Uncharacterized protein n=1 Tax=Pseudonocardia asaccharolytica DSM 44247 = NBRC 16224 TaxID=1123024 RepID=A0A511D040_9PSEU|nr:hypothetical protein PA7_19830 [Pseudonocardia asaccharolytica DSM 44247 = NBRC 16224]
MAVWATGFIATLITPGRRDSAASTTPFEEPRSRPEASMTVVAVFAFNVPSLRSTAGADTIPP